MKTNNSFFPTIKGIFPLLFFLQLPLCISCGDGKDSSTDSPPDGVEHPAVIRLEVKGLSMTRSQSSSLPDASAEESVRNAVIGIFSGAPDNSALSIQELSTVKLGEGQTNTVLCPLEGSASYEGCTAIVVGNVPSGSVSDLCSAADRNTFQSKVLSLEACTSDGGAQIASRLPMSGEVRDASGKGTFTLVPGGSISGLSVSLVRMVSRITLSSLKTDFSGTQYPYATFTPTRVFLYNALSASRVNTSLEPSVSMPSDATYITGGGSWNGSSWSGSNSFLYEDIPAGGTSGYYWFYAFANDGSVRPTAFVIQGLFDPDGAGSLAGSMVFYPVVINKIQPGTDFNAGYSGGTSTGSIIRNRQYNLNVKLSGKGVDSPEKSIIPGYLGVSLSVSGWNGEPVDQSVEFY